MGIVTWLNRSPNWHPANGGVAPLAAATVTIPAGAVSGLVIVQEEVQVPGIRRSRGVYLEVLEPSTFVDVPIEVDVFDGANPASMLATLKGAFAKRFTRELSELGSGAFSIGRTDPKATAGNLAIGNLVKFRVAGTYRHAVWIEEPATTVVSSGEEGGEVIAINGRGALAYLERAAVYPPVWPPAAAWVVASSFADNGAIGTTSLAVPKPAGSAAGDVQIVGVLCTGAAPTTPPGWKRIRDVTEGSLRLALSALEYIFVESNRARCLRAPHRTDTTQFDLFNGVATCIFWARSLLRDARRWRVSWNGARRSAQ